MHWGRILLVQPALDIKPIVFVHPVVSDACRIMTRGAVREVWYINVVDVASQRSFLGCVCDEGRMNVDSEGSRRIAIDGIEILCVQSRDLQQE